MALNNQCLNAFNLVDRTLFESSIKNLNIVPPVINAILISASDYVRKLIRTASGIPSFPAVDNKKQKVAYFKFFLITVLNVYAFKFLHK